MSFVLAESFYFLGKFDFVPNAIGSMDQTRNIIAITLDVMRSGETRSIAQVNPLSDGNSCR